MSIGPLATRLIAAVITLPLAVSALLASPYDELRIKPEQVFEFAQKPKVTRNGDIITITFESRGFCDCTVAIENAQSKIVRHLASGVLGGNAPPPFKKNSKRQTIVWDGKDDLGRYIDDRDSHTIRVSLGLKPRFERTLFWEPKRRAQGEFGNWVAVPAAAPEGVYVYRGANAEYIHFFDHDGNYVRTLYPFPRNKLQDVKGLKWIAFPPDGERFPAKWGMAQNTLLTASVGATHDTKWPGGGSLLGRNYNQSTALAVQKNRIALAGYRLNRLAPDGSTPRLGSGQAGGLTLDGPKTSFKGPLVRSFDVGQDEKRLQLNVGPRSMAFSPDGQWMYLAGYLVGAKARYWLHGVARTRFGGAGDAECWIGKMNSDGHGTDNAHFSVPASVAVDTKGRVYVADYGNDRIQVFSEEGRHLKTIPVKKPTQVFLHPKTGDLYVCSWVMFVKYLFADKKGALNRALHVPATLTHLGPLEAPQRKATVTLPLGAYRAKYTGDYTQGLDYRVEMDFHTDPFRVWIVQFTKRSRSLFYGPYSGPLQSGRFSENIEIYELREGKLQLKRSFSEDVRKTVVREAPPAYARQRLYFDHENEWFYVGEGRSKAISELVRIDPASGAIRLVPLPFVAEDLGFDMQSMAYLRTADRLVRYHAVQWREVPYDYGMEMNRVSHMGAGKGAKVISGISFLGQGAASHQHGGMGVSPDGTVIVEALWNLQAKHRKSKKALMSKNLYSPRLFPGRRAGVQIRMFNKHGKCLTMDALPGVGYCQGMQIDKDRNIYVQTDYVRMYGGRRFINGYSCTLMKVKPEKAAILTGGAPVKLDPVPKRPRDVHVGWVKDAEWLYGGVGLSAIMRFDVTPTGNCHCDANARFVLDCYARSFVSESDRYRIAVLDTNGNLITRIGRYGNVEDGMPLIKAGGPPNPRSIGGDEVAIMHCLQMTTHTDKRLFLADWGNYRIVSVKLGYHAEEKVALKDVPDRGK